MPDQIEAAIIETAECIARAQDISRDGSLQVVVMANVRDRARTFIRDAATHRAVARAGDIVLASCHNGRITMTGRPVVY